MLIHFVGFLDIFQFAVLNFPYITNNLLFFH